MKEVSSKSNPQIKQRRKYDAAFKRDAVAHWLASGKPAREMAAQLGIRDNDLYLWKKTHAPRTPATQNEMEEELAALRHENAQLRERCHILKKTLGILSEPPASASNGSTR